MSNVVRIPRPFGVTSMVMEYNKSKDKESLKHLRDYLLNQWFINNGVFCGKTYDTSQFAQFLGLTRDDIRLYMRDQLMASRIWDRENQEGMVNALLGEQLAWLMEDRMEVSQQVNLLKQSQGGTYKPFVSSELNKAFKLKLDTSNSLQQVLRTLMGGGSVNIFNQLNQQNNTQVNQGISLDEARQLIIETQNNQYISKSDEVKLLESKYDLKSLPEVVVTRQDQSEFKSTLNQSELSQITDRYKETMKLTSQEHHDMRREIEQNIDPSADDPELDIYEDVEYNEEPFDPSSFLIP